MDKLSLLILGVAGGAGHVYEGCCSSSFLILKNEKPFCLVDLGLGVTRTLKSYGFDIPDKVIITHNHTDHAGELPVVLRVEEAKGRQLQIYSAKPVSGRLQKHRLAEHAELYESTNLAKWLSPSPHEQIALSDELSITFIPAQHSECCFGFVVSNNDTPLIGYTADSGFNKELYDTVSKCQVAIYDAREQGNKWHASFDEVAPYAADGGAIISHGLSNISTQRTMNLLFPGQIINL